MHTLEHIKISTYETIILPFNCVYVEHGFLLWEMNVNYRCLKTDCLGKYLANWDSEI
jgi:hypothetical protein